MYLFSKTRETYSVNWNLLTKLKTKFVFPIHHNKQLQNLNMDIFVWFSTVVDAIHKNVLNWNISKRLSCDLYVGEWGLGYFLDSRVNNQSIIIKYTIYFNCVKIKTILHQKASILFWSDSIIWLCINIS